MKKFNLEKAKKGANIITKKGKDVKILLFDRDNNKFPIVAIVENKHVYCFTNEGGFFTNKDSDNDLKLKE